MCNGRGREVPRCIPAARAPGSHGPARLPVGRPGPPGCPGNRVPAPEEAGGGQGSYDRGMRALLPSTALLLCLLTTACAGRREVRPQGAMQKVAVVVGSRVDALPAYSVRQEMQGETNPRTVLVSQTASALDSRGFDVVARRISAAPYPATEEVVQLIADNGAQGAVVVVLDWVDVSAIEVQGRAEVMLDTVVVGPGGEVTWRNQTRSVHQVGVYQADWQSYLRKAITEAIRAVP